MATKYTLTTAFTAITETSGTIQNVGNESVELASSTNAVEGEGIVLNPSEKRSFKGALSARSIGDAGTDVNVVDFIEAGEGGEEYVLPIASDAELGGIKISNSFTVASDGTLSIKKAGKTILGAVKSSDDEGKVTVNNDGTMTYNPLGYRQPSTTYAVGNIAYHSALPTGWYLECTTAGTTSAGNITPTSTIGGTVSDGTVVWTVNRDLPLIGGGALTGTNLTWKGNDLGSSAIVAKSIGDNGYIKYASGLILQWGHITVAQNTVQKINLPITVPTAIYSVVATVIASSVPDSQFVVTANVAGEKNLYLSHSYPASIGVSYILICN